MLASSVRLRESNLTSTVLTGSTLNQSTQKCFFFGQKFFAKSHLLIASEWTQDDHTSKVPIYECLLCAHDTQESQRWVAFETPDQYALHIENEHTILSFQALPDMFIIKKRKDSTTIL
jgi:hypothetical protein